MMKSRRVVWGVVVGTVVLLIAVATGTALKVVSIDRQFRINNNVVPPQDFRAARAVYPFSVVPGGLESPQELEKSIQQDPVVAAHYKGIIPWQFYRVVLNHDIEGRVSYRVGDRVMWTKGKVRVRAGEAVLTDGRTLIRGRCGNLISPALRTDNAPPTVPGGPPEPPEIALNTPVPPVYPTASTPRTPFAPEVPMIPTPGDVLPPIQTGHGIGPIPTTPANPGTPPIPQTPPAPQSPPSSWPSTGGDPPPVVPPSGWENTPPPAIVPEPSSIILLGIGLASLTAYKKYRR